MGAMAKVETVTVLFTDLVDSTSLRVQIGEEEADRLRARHDRLVVAAIAEHNGRLVKHTGDGAMATFAGASDAVSAGVAIQQAIEVSNRRSGDHQLAVRIGLSAGDVSAEENDCFGLPVVEAQRLESAATAGQILCSSLVRALARGRGGHAFRSIGALELKGLAEPLEADEVEWAPLADEIATTTVSLPPALQRGTSFSFAGRDVERATLLDEWEAVRRGATRIVLLAGEPGVGKTRLASEVAGEFLGGGGTVLAGRCDELVRTPYQPFAEALCWQVKKVGPAVELGHLGGELARLVPDLDVIVPGLPAPLAADTDAERTKLFDAVHGWLSATTKGAPALLVLDDLHWADQGTLLLLRHVAMTTPVSGLLVLATYRDTDVDRQHPLTAVLAEMRRRAEVTRLSIEGLDEDGVTELVAAAAGHDLDASGVMLARALHGETAGNPFFVSEVLRHLAESGAIEQRDGAWVAADGLGGLVLPEGVRDVVGRRLSVLPEETQQLLYAAAVIGPEFDLDLLVVVAAGGDEDAALDGLDPALAASLIDEVGVGSYRFAHALVRSTLHQELSSTRRSRLHRRVAEALEAAHADDLDSVAADLAYHWSEAHAGGAEQALSYARRAAEIALDRLAPDESARWYRHAIDLLDGTDPHLEAELAVRLAIAATLGGLRDHQELVLQAARVAEACGDVALMTEALLISRRASFDQAQPASPEKIDLLERALAATPADAVAGRAGLLIELGVELIYTGDVERRRAVVDEAAQLIPEIADPELRLRLRHRSGQARPWNEMTSAVLRQAAADSQADAAACESSADPEMRLTPILQRWFTALRLGDGARAEELYPVFAALAKETSHPTIEEFVPFIGVQLALIRGDLDEAERQGELMDRVWTAHGADALATYSNSVQYQLVRERGLMPSLADQMTAVLRPEPPPQPTVQAALVALALVEAGRVVDARSMLEERSRAGFADMSADAGMPVSQGAWAEVAARTGHAEASEAMYAMLIHDPDIHLATGGWYLGSASYYLGLLAAALDRGDEARSWYERAVEHHEQMRTPPWLARTYIDLAVLEGGDRQRQLAQRALDIIKDRPLEAIRHRAESLL